jgi:hypothetical protein
MAPGPEGFHAWFKWLLGTHRIGQYEHMRPEYRHRLPVIEANYQEWAEAGEGHLFADCVKSRVAG